MDLPKFYQLTFGFTYRITVSLSNIVIPLFTLWNISSKLAKLRGSPPKEVC